MKNILLGIIGSLILLNTTCICLELLKYSACVNEREQALSQQLLEYQRRALQGKRVYSKVQPESSSA